jgi:hypothetical protein
MDAIEFCKIPGNLGDALLGSMVLKNILRLEVRISPH